MASIFECEILAPNREIFAGRVSEVILPGHDGQVGVLPEHGDYVGVLGTGILTFVLEAQPFSVMVSGGVYVVKDGKLRVLAESAEESREVVIAAAKRRLVEVEQVLVGKSQFDEDYRDVELEALQLQAKIDLASR